MRQRQPCMAGLCLGEDLGFKHSAGFSSTYKHYKVSGSSSSFCLSAWPHLRVSQTVKAALGEHQLLPGPLLGLLVSMKSSGFWEVRDTKLLLSITCVFPILCPCLDVACWSTASGPAGTHWQGKGELFLSTSERYKGHLANFSVREGSATALALCRVKDCKEHVLKKYFACGR